MRRKDREINDREEIESIIAKSDVCTVALSNDNYPYLVTMNFGYCPGSVPKIYFHCSREGKKLDMIRKNNYVCFEFFTDNKLHGGESACDYGTSYRSVVGYGTVSPVNDEEEKIAALNSIMEHYTGKSNFEFRPGTLAGTYVLRLDISEMTGKMC